ncbi:hypothetical protein TcWFU_007719 [Taenia crassiceps]|uniref:Secreted protein n=1 Tax=Taenia crassiceps TaxID=6207 RepID=A0ABR4QI64_9CEST
MSRAYDAFPPLLLIFHLLICFEQKVYHCAVSASFPSLRSTQLYPFEVDLPVSGPRPNTQSGAAANKSVVYFRSVYCET